MNVNNKEKENSSSSIKIIKLNLLPLQLINQNQNKIKKKFYCLYKNGKKYIVKKKEKDSDSLKEIKYEKKVKINYLEKEIYYKFKQKYDKMCNNYNSIVTTRLIHNISSHVVALFKEYLIYGDIFEFLTKNYNLKKSTYLLKEIINFYISNNVIYPNYMILPEGIYIYKNIQHKQRIIDNQEENAKKKKKENDEENILTSKVMDSILNQTNTSEARDCFGINNKSLNEIEENNKINILIEKINKIEKNINNKNNVFQKKKLIRITNNNQDLKENKFFQMCKYINKNNLYLTIKNDNLNDKYFYKKINSNKSNKKTKVGELFSTMTHYKNNNNNLFETINTDSHSNKKRKMKTIEVNDLNTRKYSFFKSLKEDYNNNKYSNHSPYIIKRPTKKSTSYNVNKIYNNNTYNNQIYYKKSSNSINKLELNNYFNINIDEDNNPKIYQKKNNKIFRLNTEKNFDYLNRKTINFDLNINKKINKKNSGIIYGNLILNNKNKYIITKDDNNKNMKDEPKIYNKINNQKKLIISNNTLSNFKNVNYSNHNFKSISRMIKSKYIIDDEINNNAFNNLYHSQNKIVYKTPLSSKNSSIKLGKNKEENDYNSKNIYISNNITNNNYYTIENNPRKDGKLFMKRYLKNIEVNKEKKNKILNLKNQADKKIFLNTEPNTYSSINDGKSKSNSKNYYDISKKLSINEIISPYKNRLINNTTLKSLDKYSLKYLLNRFNNSKDKNRNKLNIENNQNNNKFKTINAKKDTDIDNKIRLKKRYLILHNNKNTSNLRNIKKYSQMNNLEVNSNNKNKEYFKTIDSSNRNKLKVFSLSTKNSNRNNNIKYFK